MFKSFSVTIFFCLFCLVAFPEILFASENLTGKVIAVLDGDTIKVLVDHKKELKIRFSGMDAPEKDQPFGMQSKKHLAHKIFCKVVEVKVNTVDKYGRSVADVYFDGQWINREMIAEGDAWHYKKYSKDKELAQAEKDARSNKLGLWHDKNPMPPWEWRHGGKKSLSFHKNKADVVESNPVDGTQTSDSGSFWLNTKSKVRHNKTCQYFGKGENGRACSDNEGKPCGKCGG